MVSQQAILVVDYVAALSARHACSSVGSTAGNGCKRVVLIVSSDQTFGVTQRNVAEAACKTEF